MGLPLLINKTEAVNQKALQRQVEALRKATKGNEADVGMGPGKTEAHGISGERVIALFIMHELFLSAGRGGLMALIMSH